MGFTPTTWNSGTAPGISNTELNRIETGIDQLWEGLRDIDVETDSFTLDLTQAGKVVEVNKATSVSVTVPPNGDVAFVVGTFIDIVAVGAGTVTLVEGSGVTIRKRADLSLTIRAQWSGVSLYKRATNEWVLVGDLLPA